VDGCREWSALWYLEPVQPPAQPDSATAPAPLVISHRGNGFGHLENTIAAFAAAAEAGVAGVELDVRLTQDSVPVILHDHRTSIFGGPARTVSKTPRLDLHAGIPTLAAALDLLLPTMPVDVEIKSINGDLQPIFALCDRPGVRISSFDWAILAECRAALPQVPRALLVPERFGLETILRAAERLGGEGIHLSMRQLDPLWVRVLHALGLKVRVYTPNRIPAWRRAQKAGVDAIMTDRPLACGRWLGNEAT
jgi:glycerophosphoryl diester phosphodiesterase